MLKMIKRFAAIISLNLILFFMAGGAAFAAKPFIIDTDMGVDDVIAILYLLQRPDIEIKAITITGDGNVHCKPGLLNMLGLLKMMKQTNIPVACGRAKPLVGEHHFPLFVLKDSDTLSGAATLLPHVKPPKPQRAVDLMIKTLQQSSQPVTIVAIGPLTNIAEALQKAPQIKNHIRAIYIMGGAINALGNIPEVDHTIKNSVSEWNFYLDPRAADIVLNQKIPLTLLTLDVTNRLPVDMSFYEQVQNDHKTVAADYVFALLKNNINLLETKDWWYFWDPLLAVIASDESIADFKEKHLRVLLTPEEQSGETVVDNEVKYKVRVVTRVNEDKFKEILLKYLNRSHS